jgi:hypothetical protein
VKKLLLAGTLLCCAIAYGRVPFVEPTQVLRVAGLGLGSADVDGDWILAVGYHRENVDPNDPDYTFDIWERIVVFHRSASGQWQMVQTLADEYLIFNSDEHPPPAHDLVLENGVAAFSTNSGLHVFERVSGTWVPRSVIGAPQSSPVDLEFDGVTLLASDGSCATAATAYTRQSNGSWAAQGELIGQPQCDEFFQRRMAVSGSRALVFEDGPWNSTPNDQVRVFERSGGAWLPVTTLPPPPGPPTPLDLFGPPVALRGDLALVAGNGTHVYRRGASGFAHAGQIPLLTYFFDQPFGYNLKIGSQFVVQTYSGPATGNDIAVMQPNSAGGYDHVATLGGAYDQNSVNVCGRRVVATGWGIQVYDLPQTIAPTPAKLHDFESGTAGWTALAGQFAVVQRGATRVYRQSSLTGDAVAVNSADLKATLVTADVRAIQFESPTRWVGLMARYLDENNLYYVTLRGDNHVAIRKKVNGVITELASFAPPVQVGKNYRVSFEVVGNRLRYYHNEYVITAYDNDDSLPHGRAGLRTYRATADFDNVVITPVPLVELGGGPRYADISYFDIVDGSWTAGGVFNVEQTTTGGNARILHGPATDDQILRVSARLNSLGSQATGSHWVGAMVRYTDPSNYYYVSLRAGNQLSLRKVVNGVITELAHVAFTVNMNQAYRLRLEAIGTKLIVYVNDEVRLQASDSSHTQGRQGLVTYRAAASFGGLETFQP